MITITKDPSLTVSYESLTQRGAEYFSSQPGLWTHKPCTLGAHNIPLGILLQKSSSAIGLTKLSSKLLVKNLAVFKGQLIEPALLCLQPCQTILRVTFILISNIYTLNMFMMNQSIAPQVD